LICSGVFVCLQEYLFFFLIKMSEKSKCISHSVTPVQKQRKTISDVDELYAVHWLGEEERIVNIYRASELAKTTVCMFRHNADKSYHTAFNVREFKFFFKYSFFLIYTS
jgi:hypothetical protein